MSPAPSTTSTPSTSAPSAPTRTARPTDRWLGTVADVMPPLQGPEGVAERLLLLVHYGIDWTDGWVANRRSSYWDRLLPDRVITATYRANNLRRWWRELSHELGSTPRNHAERSDLEQLLRAADPHDVLEVLRFETEPLLLRVRIVTEAVRGHHAPAREESNP